MTTLYRSVLIETAEQARDLASWTVATPPDKSGEPVWKCTCGRWESDGSDRRDSDMVGWTALVPVEASEEFAAFTGPDGSMLGARFSSGIPLLGTGSIANFPRSRRLVTPWEPA